jgi:hypothetical protein
MNHAKFVICVDNADYPASLERRKIYRVVADREALSLGQIRVIDESGEDYLYPLSCFVGVDLPDGTEAAVFQAA